MNVGGRETRQSRSLDLQHPPATEPVTYPLPQPRAELEYFETG